jgi:hypothetical protein
VEMTEGLTTPSPIHFKCVPLESELLGIESTPPAPNHRGGGETFVAHFQVGRNFCHW